MVDQEEASEESPLLRNAETPRNESVASNGSTAQGKPLANGSAADGGENGAVEEPRNGMPELQKQMKYILPAISIGVIIIIENLLLSDMLMAVAGPSGRSGSDHHGFQLWQDRKRFEGVESNPMDRDCVCFFHPF